MRAGSDAASDWSERLVAWLVPFDYCSAPYLQLKVSSILFVCLVGPETEPWLLWTHSSALGAHACPTSVWYFSHPLRGKRRQGSRFRARPSNHIMAWIKTVSMAEADEDLRRAMETQRALYPVEYATPVHPVEGGGAQIVESHSLIPEALYHAFATFGVLMSPKLPLTRRQHEIITTMVSVTNRCVY
jgi:hypothetical protein